jgi:NAD+ kinase
VSPGDLSSGESVEPADRSAAGSATDAVSPHGLSRPAPFAATLRSALILADTEKAAVGEVLPELRRLLEGHLESVSVIEDARTFCDGAVCKNVEAPDGTPDLVVVLGGDGTVLAAARAFADNPVPILGINFGRVGFLAPVEAQNWRAGMMDALEGRAILEPRMRLDVRLSTGEQAVALNDVVLSRSAEAGMVDLRLEADGARVSDYRADGLIFATPSGSTAYSLASGGPVLSPSMHGTVVTPIAAHALSHRPLVLRPDAEISVHVMGTRAPTSVTLDGRPFGSLEVGSSMRVERHPETYPLLSPSGMDPWRRLRDRLGWRGSLDEGS